MAILAIHVSNLFEYGAYVGVDELLLREYLIDKTLDVNNLDYFVTKEEYLNVYSTLFKQVNHPYFGLYFGCYLNIKSLGFIAEISLNASNIKQAIFILQQYLTSVFPIVSLDVVDENDSVTLTLTSDCKHAELKTQLLDTVFCFIYRELTLMLSYGLSPKLKLPYKNREKYNDLLSFEVECANAHQLILNKDILTTPINEKRVKQIEYLLPKLIQLLTVNEIKYGEFSLKVRSMILNMCSPEPPTFKHVVKQFTMSERTFQRKLMQEGNSYRKIVNDIKKELSDYLKEGGQIQTKEIASILGYTQTSSYLHAVRRWKKD